MLCSGDLLGQATPLPGAGCCSVKMKPLRNQVEDSNGGYILAREDGSAAQDLDGYGEPLPCCGCGVGWCSFVLGFCLPLLWYYGTFVFFFSRYQRDLRERPGFAACAIAALVFTVGVTILTIVLLAT